MKSAVIESSGQAGLPRHTTLTTPAPGGSLRHGEPPPTWLRRARGLAGATRRARASALIVSLVAAAGVSATAAYAGSGPVMGACANLAMGARGPAVVEIQRLVHATPDGIFGPLTRGAVEAYQRAHRLRVTGQVDAVTWSALPRAVELVACGAPVSGVPTFCPRLSVGSLGPSVAVLQLAVGASTDGDFGPLTEAALRAAQRRLHLPVTGAATAATWSALRLVGTPACTAVARPPARVPAAVAQRSGSAPPVRPAAPVRKPAEPADAAAQRAVAELVRQLLAQVPSGQPAPPSTTVAEVLAFAKAQEGKPYIWGGVGPRGYDCSGLVLASYRAAGINLARTAAEQYLGQPRVPLNELQPGDIVFYASDLTEPATIYHDAIYIGAGELVNAPYPGQLVRQERLFVAGLLPVAVRPAAALSLPLRPGALGWSVRQVQQDLGVAGWPVAVDGDFGPQTEAAVRALQSASRLPDTGYVDSPTWSALVALSDRRRP